jgi:hypothetical protein
MPRYPDFFIVGAQRSGTTSLYEYLRQHPAVYMSAQKETHFFARDRVQVDKDLQISSESNYLKLFANAGRQQIVGEASPSYLWHPDAARRIQAKQPHAKIIAILRNPIARAYSHYQMDLADGMTPVPFYELIVREYREAGEKVYGTGHLYVDLGLYARQLERYWDVFGRESVLVLTLHELHAEPSKVLARLAAFLEISAAPFQAIDAAKIYNQTLLPRSALMRTVLPYRWLRQTYRRIVPHDWRKTMRAQAFDVVDAPPPDAESAEFLYPIFAPEMQALQALCGIEFPDFAMTVRG